MYGLSGVGTNGSVGDFPLQGILRLVVLLEVLVQTDHDSRKT